MENYVTKEMPISPKTQAKDIEWKHRPSCVINIVEYNREIQLIMWLKLMSSIE